MSVMGLFFLLIYSVTGLYLWRQGVLGSDWLKEGDVGYVPEQPDVAPLSPQKVGLLVFLATVGCIFSLLIASFFMRQASPDWQLPTMPTILWLNYFILLASSFSIQIAHHMALIGRHPESKIWLLVAFATSFLFLFGQLVAGKDLIDQGVYAYGNPAASFFYLFTTLHGLHLMGGLIALFRTIKKIYRNSSDKLIIGSIELCAIYWHFLFFIWTLLFILLLGKGNELGVLCRRILA
ncbi:MAG: heme-copper oxidase subunit III [Methylocystis sp.]